MGWTISGHRLIIDAFPRSWLHTLCRVGPREAVVGPVVLALRGGTTAHRGPSRALLGILVREGGVRCTLPTQYSTGVLIMQVGIR